MSTGIEWTDLTWNPVTGCTKVSQGCKNCYAERLWPKVDGARVKREGGAPRAFTDVQSHPERLDAPLHWAKPRRVFVNSMSDLFHEDIDRDFILRVFMVMRRASHHTFQVLTKRPERMRHLLSEWLPHAEALADMSLQAKAPAPNVWLGVSVEDQATADSRIPLLLQSPAAIRFVSYEPALGPVDWEPFLQYEPMHEHYKMTFDMTEWRGIEWIIAGGESGPNARPAHPDWFRRTRHQCAEASVAFFFKQWGNWLPGSQYTNELHRKDAEVFSRYDTLRWDGERFDDNDPLDPSAEDEVYRVGKKAAGRLLDGREHNEYPE